MNVTTVEFNNANKIDRQYINIYERLQRIVKNYYGAKLTYKAFSSQLTRAEKTLIGLLEKNNPMRLKNKVFLPVKVDQQNIGFCEVELSRKLSSSEVARLKQLIDLLLVHSIKSSRHVSQLRKHEQFLNNIDEHNSDFENVVFLSNFNAHKKSNEVDALPNDYIPQPPTEPVMKLNLPSLIVCKNPEDSFKMARELHDLSERFAFIRLQDLDLTTAIKNGLSSFGPITIFVPEISKLTKEEQLVISKFYNNEQRSKESPTLVMGSTHSKASIEESGLVLKDILLRQSTVTLHMSKPFSHYRKAGIANFVINSMSLDRRI